jgi:hypothetical protein
MAVMERAINVALVKENFSERDSIHNLERFGKRLNVLDYSDHSQIIH